MPTVGEDDLPLHEMSTNSKQTTCSPLHMVCEVHPRCTRLVRPWAAVGASCGPTAVGWLVGVCTPCTLQPPSSSSARCAASLPVSRWHRVHTPTEHWVALGPQEAPTAAQARTSRVHRPQGGGGRTPRDHRRSGRDSTELRPQTWVFGPGGGRGGWGTGAWGRDGSSSKERVRCSLDGRARWESSEIARCTQKGHGKEAQSLRQNCSSAISESRAAGPFRRRDLRFSTALVRSSPSAVGEPLGVTRTTLQRAKQPICDLAARQKRRSPLAGRWPAASQRDRNRSYRILLGLDKLRVGLKGLFLDFNCS